MAKEFMSAEKLVRIYENRNLGMSWQEIDEKCNLKHGSSYGKYRILSTYLQGTVKGKKYIAYMEAKK